MMLNEGYEEFISMGFTPEQTIKLLFPAANEEDIKKAIEKQKNNSNNERKRATITHAQSSNSFYDKKEEDSESTSEEEEDQGAYHGYLHQRTPRGYSSSESKHNIIRGFGRGSPFYPRSTPLTVNHQSRGSLVDHCKRMQRDLVPHLEKTDSAMMRNEYQERAWSSYVSRASEPTSTSLSREQDQQQEQEEQRKQQQQRQEESASNKTIQPLEAAFNVTPNNNDSTSGKEEIASNNNNNKHSYKNAMLVSSTEEGKRNNCSESINERSSTWSEKLSRVTLSSDKSESDSSQSTRRRKDVRVKTQLYIPPHLRNKTADSARSSSVSSLTSEPPEAAVKPPSEPPKPDVKPKPVKKSIEELCRNNAMVSSLLKKQKATSSKPSGNKSNLGDSSPNSNRSPTSTRHCEGMNQNGKEIFPKSFQNQSSGKTSNLGNHVASSNSSSPKSTKHYENVNQNGLRDSTLITPSFSRSDKYLVDIPPYTSDVDTSSSGDPNDNLVEFYDIDPALLAPPPHQSDEEGTYFYLDPETNNYVSYKIENTTQDEGGGGVGSTNGASEELATPVQSRHTRRDRGSRAQNTVAGGHTYQPWRTTSYLSDDFEIQPDDFPPLN